MSLYNSLTRSNRAHLRASTFQRRQNFVQKQLHAAAAQLRAEIRHAVAVANGCGSSHTQRPPLHWQMLYDVSGCDAGDGAGGDAGENAVLMGAAAVAAIVGIGDADVVSAMCSEYVTSHAWRAIDIAAACVMLLLMMMMMLRSSPPINCITHPRAAADAPCCLMQRRLLQTQARKRNTGGNR